MNRHVVGFGRVHAGDGSGQVWEHNVCAYLPKGMSVKIFAKRMRDQALHGSGTFKKIGKGRFKVTGMCFDPSTGSERYTDSIIRAATTAERKTFKVNPGEMVTTGDGYYEKLDASGKILESYGPNSDPVGTYAADHYLYARK